MQFFFPSDQSIAGPARRPGLILLLSVALLVLLPLHSMGGRGMAARSDYAPPRVEGMGRIIAEANHESLMKAVASLEAGSLDDPKSYVPLLQMAQDLRFLVIEFSDGPATASRDIGRLDRFLAFVALSDDGHQARRREEASLSRGKRRGRAASGVAKKAPSGRRRVMRQRLASSNGKGATPNGAVPRTEPTRTTWLQIKVGPGDSLCSLARRHLGSETKIAVIIEANELYEPYIIIPGQILSIPPPGAAGLQTPRPDKMPADGPLTAEAIIAAAVEAPQAKDREHAVPSPVTVKSSDAGEPAEPSSEGPAIPGDVEPPPPTGKSLEAAKPAILALAPHVIDVLLALMGNPARTAETPAGLTSVSPAPEGAPPDTSAGRPGDSGPAGETPEVSPEVTTKEFTAEAVADLATGQAPALETASGVSAEPSAPRPVTASAASGAGATPEVPVAAATAEARAPGTTAEAVAAGSAKPATPARPAPQGPDRRAKIKALLGIVILILLGFLLHKLREMKRLAARGKLPKFEYENPLGKLDRFLGGGDDSKGDGAS